MYPARLNDTHSWLAVVWVWMNVRFNEKCDEWQALLVRLFLWIISSATFLSITSWFVISVVVYHGSVRFWLTIAALMLQSTASDCSVVAIAALWLMMWICLFALVTYWLQCLCCTQEDYVAKLQRKVANLKLSCGFAGVSGVTILQLLTFFSLH